MIYDRLEDMVATTKRHPGRVRHRTGVRNDGRITVAETELLRAVCASLHCPLPLLLEVPRPHAHERS
jgi:xanthine dehydrogenase molybdopterin-binding subunit B